MGTVVLDAVFSPVENVAITVQNMCVGERTDYNRLAIEITTDGSISPSEALHKSTSILRDHFEKLGNFEVTPTEVGETKKSAKKAKK